MRKQLLCSVAAIAIITAVSGPVAAADQAMRVKAPAPSAYVPTWTGFYLGGHLGYGWSKFNGLADSSPAISDRVGDGPRVSGFALGLHTGFNWQAGQWVYGIEGDVTATPGWQKRLCGVPGDCPENNHVYGQLDALASIRARLGMTFDRALIYATGGVAWAKKRSDAGSFQHFEHFGIKTGGVFGGGIEWKYNPNLSLRLEGLHYIFSERHSAQTLPGRSGDFFTEHGIKNATVIRVGASWHPDPGGGWGKGPVAARY
jgi:outer membrane immunogenic protein